MDNTRIYRMVFGEVYPLYVQKAQRKGRTGGEVDQILRWLTGYTDDQVRGHIEARSTFETFFAQAPGYHPDAVKVTGVICGYRVEEIEDPLVRKVRVLDKLVDELAKGKAMDKILRKA